MAMVNTSIAYAQMGEIEKAEKNLQKALKQAPDNAAANFNMGLLNAEKNELKAARGASQESIPRPIPRWRRQPIISA